MWVGHLLILPFLLGIVWQLFLLSRKMLPPSLRDAGFFLALLDPTLLSQGSMVSPDVILLFAWLYGLNGLLFRKHFHMVPATVLMLTVSFRGVLCLVPFFLLDFYLSWLRNEKLEFIRRAWMYIPAAALVIAWLILHYNVSGNFLAGSGSEYEGHRKMVGFSEMLRNAGIIAWRILDFGRIAFWILLFAVVAFRLKRKEIPGREEVKLSLSFLFPAFFLAAMFIPFSNPVSHRYFLICFPVIALLSVRMLLYISDLWIRRIAIFALAVVSISGNFWIYPDHIAKGWDSTLAHFPYFGLKDKMVEFIDSQEIEYQDVCADFPTRGGRAATHLADGDLVMFPSVNETGLQRCRYILQSNVNNGFTDEELSALKHDWILEKEFRNWWMYMRLYSHPD